jgi:uncharacterized protein (TIGR03435 family)
MRYTFVTLTLAAAISAAFGQAGDAPAPSFEVASVKAAASGGGGERRLRQNIQVSPGTVTMHGASLKSCIAWAWHVFDYEVSGPDWIDSQRYEITGKAAGAVAEDQLRQMMQGLLAERFKLAIHRQTKELSAYVLVPGKNGPKVQESKTEGETSIEPNQKQMSVTIQRAPVSQLVEMLSNVLRVPVIDQTGLKGRYDLTVNVAKYAADMAAQGKSPDSGPMDPLALISLILQEELGLKLESKKMPLDLVIVDHAEKAPVEN